MKKPHSSPQAAADDEHIDDTTLRGFTGYYMKRAWNVTRADLAATLQPFELRMITFSTLILIVDNPGLRQSRLAKALAVERPNFVAIINELEHRQLITRDKVPTDQRAYALNATTEGHDLYNTAIAAVRVQELLLFSALDVNERQTLIRALSKVESKKARAHR